MISGLTRKDMREVVSLPLSCEDTARRWASARQEERSHEVLAGPEP